MRCVARDFGNVILVGFVIEDTWSLSYYERGIQPDNYLLSEILPTCKLFSLTPHLVSRLFCMEISYDRMTWFAGGSSSLGGRSSAIISAARLNRGLNVIKTQQLDQYGLQAVSAIKRMPMNDDLVVGGLHKMLIMTWTGANFIVNKVVENVHSSKKFPPKVVLTPNQTCSVTSQYTETRSSLFAGVTNTSPRPPTNNLFQFINNSSKSSFGKVLSSKLAEVHAPIFILS